VRSIEVLLLLLVALGGLRALTPWRHDAAGALVLSATTLVVTVAHLVAEHPRWQLIPAYVAVIGVTAGGLVTGIRSEAPRPPRLFAAVNLLLAAVGRRAGLGPAGVHAAVPDRPGGGGAPSRSRGRIPTGRNGTATRPAPRVSSSRRSGTRRTPTSGSTPAPGSTSPSGSVRSPPGSSTCRPSPSATSGSSGRTPRRRPRGARRPPPARWCSTRTAGAGSGPSTPTCSRTWPATATSWSRSITPTARSRPCSPTAGSPRWTRRRSPTGSRPRSGTTPVRSSSPRSRGTSRPSSTSSPPSSRGGARHRRRRPPGHPRPLILACSGCRPAAPWSGSTRGSNRSPTTSSAPGSPSRCCRCAARSGSEDRTTGACAGSTPAAATTRDGSPSRGPPTGTSPCCRG
jgi:hypothetical protein